ncbi:MAG: flagellar basal body P-ring protein FlgI [Thiotrichaceae bacterium]|nr:flagellar basal body P-ring protein FlgI [Thiotrichaceae bacterium]PCI15082.1 MAG: flagellar biosynthesis protein FlgI [Thiotrichales bacterium]
MNKKWLLTPFLLATIFMAGAAQAERIKDIANVAGVRANQLVGYGLVVGLDGTGDQTSQTPFTIQSMLSMLAQFGITLPPGSNPQLKNVAAVSLHTNLPAFAKPGQLLDVTVSSLGNSKSLRGGSLLMAPLKGADGQIYAIAQGNLVVGGFGAGGSDGSRITVNIPSVGRIPGGATVERAAPTSFGSEDSIVLNLHGPDFTTSKRVAEAINSAIGMGTAYPIDASSIKVNAPRSHAQRVIFLSIVENITLEPGEASARIIVNSRTGTVVIGRHVRVTSAAVAHGSLTVTIVEQVAVSQPTGPLSGGSTVVVPASDIAISQETNRMFMFSPGVSLNEIVQAVNQVGAAPGDLIAILEALKEAGALRAELIVI